MPESVLHPLGMQSSDFSLNTQDANMSNSYWRSKEVDVLALRDLPAMGLVTNVTDLAQIVKMLNADGVSDEPTIKANDQDPQFKDIFYSEILPDLKHRGKIVIVISHDERCFNCADSVLKIDEGQLVPVRSEVA